MDFEDILREAIQADELLSLVLSKPCTGCGVVQDKWTVRPIELRGRRFYQWTARGNGQETHENHSPEGTLSKAGECFQIQFLHGHVFTSTRDYSARVNRKGQVKITSSAPSKQQSGIANHNRGKQYLLPENQPCPFLAEIGVMTPAGKVKANHFKKFRQINRYLELVNDVIPHLPQAGKIKVVDFGCGKSYLTFALHHLLTQILEREVQIIGLDRKANVVRECQTIANNLHCQGLEFREGELWEHQQAEVHLAVSLHACDTATDEALAKAVAWNADVIFAVPCCQHEIAKRLPDTFFPAVQQHGILKDRLAAILTDALRAETLKELGYKTQVVEFIDLEHTAKNVLIRAIRRREPKPSNPQTPSQLQELKSAIGIEQFHLDEALSMLNIPASVACQPYDVHE